MLLTDAEVQRVRAILAHDQHESLEAAPSVDQLPLLGAHLACVLLEHVQQEEEDSPCFGPLQLQLGLGRSPYHFDSDVS
jgi:hypothetical protein